MTEYSTLAGWIDSPTDVAPALDGEVVCDVVVVGGGYTGMAAALRLAECGADVVLLESSFCGWGASSRNAGHLTPTICGDPQLLATVYRRRAEELVRVADAAVRFVEELIVRTGIACDYERVGNVSAALTPGQLRRAEGIARFLAGTGGEVEFVEGARAGLPASFLGGILERAGGILDPGRFALGLRAAVLASAATVYERSPVGEISSVGGEVVVSGPSGRVRAQQLLLATNAHTRDLGIAAPRMVVPLWVTLAETEPVGADRLADLGWASRSGIYTQHVILESYRPTARGSIVFGSRLPRRQRAALHARSPDPSVVADLVRGLRDRFPDLRDVGIERTWGGYIAMTPSWLPIVGELSPRISYAVGFNGHGLAQAPYLGTLLADRLAGTGTHDDLRSLWRDHPRFAPAPLFSGPALRAGWGLDRLADRRARRRRPA